MTFTVSRIFPLEMFSYYGQQPDYGRSFIKSEILVSSNVSNIYQFDFEMSIEDLLFREVFFDHLKYGITSLRTSNEFLIRNRTRIRNFFDKNVQILNSKQFHDMDKHEMSSTVEDIKSFLGLMYLDGEMDDEIDYSSYFQTFVLGGSTSSNSGYGITTSSSTSFNSISFNIHNNAIDSNLLSYYSATGSSEPYSVNYSCYCDCSANPTSMAIGSHTLHMAKTI